MVDQTMPNLHLSRSRLIDTGLFIVVVLWIVSVTALYVSQEHNLYWWVDWWYSALSLTETARHSPIQALQAIQQTLSGDYTRLYVLPLMPFILLFGDSRLVYEIGLALVYLLPFVLTLGAIATELIAVPSRPVFWSTVVLALLIPVIWLPTFLGIPDTGAALFIALATLVYLKPTSRHWWQIPLIGILLAIAMLLRRHFTYGAIAVLVAIAGESLHTVFSHPHSFQAIGNRLWRAGLRLLLIVLCIGLTIKLTGSKFIETALSSNYQTLYTDWSMPLGETIRRYGLYYGWVTVVLAAVGWLIGSLRQNLNQKAANVLGLMGICACLIWLGWLRYWNVFYSLHLTPFLVMGLTLFVWEVGSALKQRMRAVILASASVYLISNLILGITPLGNFDHPGMDLFSLNSSPYVETNTDKWLSLTRYLRQMASAQQPIYAESYPLIRRTEQVIAPRQQPILNLLQPSWIASRDPYPLAALLQAHYVLLAETVASPVPSIAQTPSQPAKSLERFQLPTRLEITQPGSDNVSTLVSDLFTKHWKLSQDFERLPQSFDIGNGQAMVIYHRLHPTSVETAVQTLARMQQDVQLSASQPDWISLQQDSKPWHVNKNLDRTYQLISDRSASQPPASFKLEPSIHFLYVPKLPSQIQMSGTLKPLSNPICEPTSLQLITVNHQGVRTGSAPPVTMAKTAVKFTRSLSTQPTDYLLLTVSSQSNHCSVEINDVAVSKIQV
jgi:hypothetical protein